ncbi:serine-threonine protein [Ophiostoma piceae UAMH 11346]|uniref:EKC/KEOPS complex subunit BUD32 n=1 Tax=Ophiostoma piceae (strain UAMH 11346) TaxID=1262450 RepID=S3CGP7_OPHP1|nr:serine-threonine protein [Ophiostoma piceae UAMH 11346]
MWWSIIGITFDVIVTCTDGKTALKGYQVWEDGRLRANCEFPCEEVLAREAYIYRYIGEHAQILQCFGLEEVHPGVNSLRIEYASRGDLRHYIQKTKNTTSNIESSSSPVPSMPTRLRMAMDVAKGVAHLHSRGVFHSDLSCRNLFLFDDLRVKLGDFGGSMIDPERDPAHAGTQYGKANTTEEAEYALPLRGRTYEDLPLVKRELFALGSAIYEIAAWGRVYSTAKDEDEREGMKERGELPPLDDCGLPAGLELIIQDCWEENYTCAEDVARDLEGVLTSFENEENRQTVL